MSVTELSIENKTPKAGAGDTTRWLAVLLNNSNTGSYGREGEVEFGALVDICERTKGRNRIAQAAGHLPSLWPGRRSYLKT